MRINAKKGKAAVDEHKSTCWWFQHVEQPKKHGCIMGKPVIIEKDSKKHQNKQTGI